MNSNNDVHLAIAYTLKLIKDGHSIFRFPQKATKKKALKTKKSKESKLDIPQVKTMILDNDIGYIKLSGMQIINDSLSKSYTLMVRKALLGQFSQFIGLGY